MTTPLRSDMNLLNSNPSTELSNTSPYRNRTPNPMDISNFSTPVSYSAVYAYQDVDTSLAGRDTEVLLNSGKKAKISIFNSSYLSAENLLGLVAGSPHRRRKRIKTYGWVLPVVLILIFLLVLLALSSPFTTLSPYNPYNSDLSDYPLVNLPDGSKINLLSLSLVGKYLRIDPTSPSQQLVFSEKIPWRHGSTLEVFQYDSSCFQLRSMRNLWLRVDYDSGEVLADGLLKLQATFFAAVRPLSNASHPLSAAPSASYSAASAPASPSEPLLLKVCKRNVWLQAQSPQPLYTDPYGSDAAMPVRLTIRPFSPSQMASAGAVSRDRSPRPNPNPSPNPGSSYWSWLPFSLTPHTFALSLPSRSQVSALLAKLDEGVGLWSRLDPARAGHLRSFSGPHDPSEDRRALTLQEPVPSDALLALRTLRPVRGVNLGGWFIPEVWMLPGFFRDSKLGWAASLCRLVKQNRTVAEERMAGQLRDWLSEGDFADMARLGFNSVRLPVGYWNLIQDPYGLFAPQDVSVSLGYIDWAFAMADKHGLSVLLDLHGAPGSQNGIDHSGCSMEPAWSSPRNVNLTLVTIEAMARRYGRKPALLGFELLNEPARALSEANHSLLVSFYERAYRIIRRHSHPEALVVFNELYERYFTWWRDALREPAYYNVVMDWHLYNWQAPYTEESRSRHITDAMAWSGLIDMYSVQHPIMVGEWSMSTGTSMQVGQVFVDACAVAFRRASAGWYLWNWKIQRTEEGKGELGLTVRYDQWDVQQQMGLADGLNPLRLDG